MTGGRVSSTLAPAPVAQLAEATVSNTVKCRFESDPGHVAALRAPVTASAVRSSRPMGSWLVERRLTQVSLRLKSLRSELAVIDEQLLHLGDDADDQAIRALVAETPAASFEARDARRHVDALAKHRAHVAAEIASLERRQDDLLDRM